MEKLSSTHFSFNVCRDVKDICRPLLRHLPITHFCFGRTFHDGSTAVLTPTHSMLEKLHQLNIVGAGKYGNFLPAGQYIYEAMDKKIIPDNVSKKYREMVHIDHHIMFVENHLNYDDMFCFSTDPRQKGMTSFYLNNRDLLENFIGHFKEKAGLLIQQAEKHRITVCKVIEECQIPFINPIADKRRQFFEAIGETDGLFSIDQSIKIADQVDLARLKIIH